MRKIIPAHLNSFITLQGLGTEGTIQISETACRCRYKEGCPNPFETAPSIFTKYFKTITSVDITFYRLFTVGTNRHYLYRSLKLFL